MKLGQRAHGGIQRIADSLGVDAGRRWGQHDGSCLTKSSRCRLNTQTALSRTESMPPGHELAGLYDWAAPTWRLWPERRRHAGEYPAGSHCVRAYQIESVPILRLIFHLALRQAEAFTRSVVHMLGSNWVYPIAQPCSGAFVASLVASSRPPERRFCPPRARLRGAYDGELVHQVAAAARQHDPPLNVVIPARASV